MKRIWDLMSRQNWILDGLWVVAGLLAIWAAWLFAQGDALVFLTAVLALATGYYAWMSNRMARSSRAAHGLLIEQEKARRQPVLILHLGVHSNRRWLTNASAHPVFLLGGHLTTQEHPRVVHWVTARLADARPGTEFQPWLAIPPSGTAELDSTYRKAVDLMLLDFRYPPLGDMACALVALNLPGPVSAPSHGVAVSGGPSPEKTHPVDVQLRFAEPGQAMATEAPWKAWKP